MSNSYAKLRYHVLFNTLDGYPVITPDIQDQMYRYIGGIINRQRGSLLEIGGQTDHVHLLLGIHQDHAVADMVRLIKANSSKWINTSDRPFAWQRGYAGFTVSESEVSRVRRFIRDQDRFHRKVSYEEELRRLIELHELRMDEIDSDRRRHTYTRLRYHIVFGTKQRLPLVTPALQGALYRTAGNLVEEERGTLVEIGGMPDHVHLLLDMRPERALSDMLQSIKANTSGWMNENSGPDSPFGWQRGYGAFSLSESRVPTVRDYIRRQDEHHRTQSFEEEFRRLLVKHGLKIRGDKQWWT